MAEPTQTDSSNFENDFEKLDPLVGSAGDDFGVSSTSAPADDPFSAPLAPTSEAIPSKPLISMDEFDPMKPSPPAEPAFQPDSSSPPAKEPTPPPAPAPVAKAEPAKKPQVSTGMSQMSISS